MRPARISCCAQFASQAGKAVFAAFLGLVAVVTCGCGTPPTPQQRAVAEIRRLGGQVEMDESNQVTAVLLGNTPADDESLQRLKSLPGLRKLYLNRTRITGAGLVYLEGLSRLEELTLLSTDVGDGDLKHIAGLRRLRLLDLEDTQVTDRGLVHLYELRQLSRLYLARTRVTDAGVNALQMKLPATKIIR